MSFQHFRLQSASHPTVEILNSNSAVSPSSLSQALGQQAQDQNTTVQQYAQSSAKKGPYGSGDAEDGYTLLFENMEAFQAWRQREEEEKMVEFVKGDTHGSKAVPPRFKDHTKLVCARHSRSGRKKYVKKFPDRVRKVPSRKLDGTGCSASISYKTYFDSDQIRACYMSEHTHEIGPANLPFTKRGRKAQAEVHGRNRTGGTTANEDSSPSTSPTMTSMPSTGNTAIESPSTQQVQAAAQQQRPSTQPQTFHSTSMIAPIPAIIHPSPQMNLSQERWDRMGVLFGSVRNHARNFEYPGPSVAALESVLIRLYLESPIGGGMAPPPVAMSGIEGLMEGMGEHGH